MIAALMAARRLRFALVVDAKEKALVGSGSNGRGECAGEGTVVVNDYDCCVVFRD